MKDRSKPAAEGHCRHPDTRGYYLAGAHEACQRTEQLACSCMPGCHGVCNGGCGCLACEIRWSGMRELATA
jgi:hypothetical protein